MTSTANTQVYRVFIKASPEAVWEAITSPEWTERYGYQAPVEFDLRAGGTYRAFASKEMAAAGAPDVVVEGTVLEADPPRLLVQTWHPIWDPTSAAEPPTRLTYEIDQAREGVVRLTVTHDVTGAPSVAVMVGGGVPNAGGGWSELLSDLKTLLETGKPMLG